MHLWLALPQTPLVHWFDVGLQSASTVHDAPCVQATARAVPPDAARMSSAPAVRRFSPRFDLHVPRCWTSMTVFGLLAARWPPGMVRKLASGLIFPSVVTRYWAALDCLWGSSCADPSYSRAERPARGICDTAMYPPEKPAGRHDLCRARHSRRTAGRPTYLATALTGTSHSKVKSRLSIGDYKTGYLGEPKTAGGDGEVSGPLLIWHSASQSLLERWSQRPQVGASHETNRQCQPGGRASRRPSTRPTPEGRDSVGPTS